MAKETPPTKIEIELMKLNESISNQTKEQARTNELLKKLVDANKEFLSTLTSFLDQDHRTKLDLALKKMEQAKSMETTEFDLRY